MKLGDDPVPTPCCICGEPITHTWTELPTGRKGEALSVHHRNHDNTDHRWENVDAAHHGCNATDLSDDGKERQRAGIRDAWADATAEERAQWRQRISEGGRRRWAASRRIPDTVTHS